MILKILPISKEKHILKSDNWIIIKRRVGKGIFYLFFIIENRMFLKAFDKCSNLNYYLYIYY
jgi:hypothetical protein